MSKNLNQVFSKRLTADDDTNLRSLLKSLESPTTKRQELDTMAMADAIISANPKIRKALQARFAKEKVTFDYSELTAEAKKEENKNRSFSEVAGNCNYVGCSDVIMRIVENQCSMVDDFTQVSLSRCEIKVPVDGLLTGSLPYIADNVDLPVLTSATTNTCLTMKAEKIGGQFIISNTVIECSVCVDELERYIRTLAYMFMRTKKDKGVQALQSGSTLATVSTTAINDLLVEGKGKLRALHVSNQTRSGKIVTYLSTQAMDKLESLKTTTGEYLFKDFINKCTEECRAYCAFGMMIKEDSAIPTVVVGQGFTSTIYMGYVEDAVFGYDPFTEINCMDCIDQRMDVTRLGGYARIEALVPPSRAKSFVRFPVTL